MYINNIIYSTTVDGLGLRNSLYTQGCPIRCEGCHNSELWEWTDGELVNDIEKLADELTENGNCNKVSILGGEPLAQWNVESVIELCKILKSKYNCNIWLYSGYTLKVISDSVDKKDVLNYIDVLVDGRYEQSKRFENGRFRGSSNQNIYQITHYETDLIIENITDKI